MEIAVISDLHLGDGSRADLFGHDDAEFLSFLTYLERNFESVVLLGDIFETLTGPSPFHQARALQACEAAHPEIVARFRTPKYTYVHGNHDLVAARTMGAHHDITLEADGKRILFTHGHEYDFVERNARWLSLAGVWFSGWLMRFGLAPLCRFFHRVDVWARGATSDPKTCRFQKWSVDLAKAKEVDVIVTGHTHRGVVAEHGSRLFLNGGSCSEGGISFLSMNTATGDYAVNTSW